MILVRQNMAALRHNAVSLSGQIANSANDFLAKMIFEIAFATRFQQHPFGATGRSSSVAWASYTAPMPPTPSNPRSS